MQGATAAAQAWLARLPQNQLAAAQAHTDVRLAAWLAAAGGLILAAALVGRLGAMARFRQWIEAGGRPRPWLARAACAGALVFAFAALKALIDAVAGWRGDAVLNAGGAPPGLGFAAHLAQAASGVVPVTLAGMVLIPALQALIRRLPRAWPLPVAATLAFVVFLLGWAPYAFAPPVDLPSLPAGPTRDGLAQLVAETRLPAAGLADASGGTALTDVTGGFGRADVVVGRDLVGATPAEARAYVGHLIGHYVHNDVFFVCLAVAAVLALGCAAAKLWGGPLARRLGASRDAGLGDPEALPALALFAIVAFVLAGLVGGAYLRWANVRADDYSLAHAREPDGLAQVLLRTWDHAAVDPSPVEQVIFYTHPPLAARLARVADWKAAHGR